MARVPVWGILVLGALAARIPPARSQEPPAAAPAALEYAGKPIEVPFRCPGDDIHWSGLACTEDDPCPVYLELSAVESLGNKIFVVGNLHSQVATLYSIVLSSDDSGKTWREPHERLRGSGLDQIQFLDFETGWIGGQVVQPFARDPFLLITSDGGKTWRHRPLFSETRAGLVQQFWFSSRTNGSLVLDRGQSGELGRYELYESPNGGETWMLRETNDKPMKLKRAGSNPDWRIRADGRTSSYAIERRQGEKWVTLAAFAVNLQACKPPAEAAPPPPPAAEPPAPSTASPPAAPRRPPSLKRPPG